MVGSELMVAAGRWWKFGGGGCKVVAEPKPRASKRGDRWKREKELRRWLVVVGDPRREIGEERERIGSWGRGAARKREREDRGRGAAEEEIGVQGAVEPEGKGLRGRERGIGVEGCCRREGAARKRAALGRERPQRREKEERERIGSVEGGGRGQKKRKEKKREREKEKERG